MISTLWSSFQFVVWCPLTEPRISICAHEIDIEPTNVHVQTRVTIFHVPVPVEFAFDDFEYSVLTYRGQLDFLRIFMRL